MWRRILDESDGSGLIISTRDACADRVRGHEPVARVTRGDLLAFGDSALSERVRTGPDERDVGWELAARGRHAASGPDQERSDRAVRGRSLLGVRIGGAGAADSGQIQVERVLVDVAARKRVVVHLR